MREYEYSRVKMATIGMLYCRGARLVLPIRRSLVIIGGNSWSNLSTGLLRGRCVGWFMKLSILPVSLSSLPVSLSSLPRSLLLLAPSLVCYRGLRTVALCKSVASSRRHVPAAAEGKTPPTSPPHLRWDQVWRFIKSDLIFLTIAVASAVLAAVINTLIPLRLGDLVNMVAHLPAGISLSSYLSLLMPSALTLAGLYVAQSVCTFGYISVLSIVGERLATRLRSALFHSILQQDVSFFDEHKTGEIISRLSGDVQDLKSSFKMVISQGLRSLTQGLGCLASLYLISPQMTGAVAIVLPTVIVVGTMFGSVLRKWSRDAQEKVAIATGVADEAIGNIRTVRAFAMEDSENKLYLEQLKSAEWACVKLGSGIALFQALSNIAINGVVLGVVCHGGLLLTTDQLSAGQLMAFLVATQTIQRSLGTLSVLFGQVVRAVSAGGRVMEYMDRQPSLSLLRGGKKLNPSEIEGKVVFKDVTFSYPLRNDQKVLSELCLELPAGHVTALCGLSGAGKSTVAALLERFYEPTCGEIELDGHALSELDASWLREHIIGYINQEPVLFATSVMENIRYGCPSASDEDVIEAARLANAHGFIQQFSEGYSTLVGERGVALSGGQKQRVAIARALLKNPPILILDEATSALDAHSESLVQEALDRACKGRTVLVIAHRLSTIRGANQIAVLHQGKLREVGSHSELIAKRGLYSELIRRQTLIN